MSLQDFDRLLEKAPSLRNVFSDCSDKSNTGGAPGVRACTVAIQRFAEVVNASNSALQRLEGPDALRLENLNKAELRDAIEYVKEMKRIHYFALGTAYAVRGFSLSKIDSMKASNDCESAAEITKHLGYGKLNKLVTTCRSIVELRSD